MKPIFWLSLLLLWLVGACHLPPLMPAGTVPFSGTPTAAPSLSTASDLPDKMVCQLTRGHRLGAEQLAPQAAPSVLALAAAADPGEQLIIMGEVYAADCTTPLPNALIEVWQTDAAGSYGKLVGKLRTDANGHYELHTIKPAYYAGEANPPPLHIHFIVDHPAAQGIETELFFADDPLLARTQIATETLVTALQPTTTADGLVLRGVFNLVLADK